MPNVKRLTREECAAKAAECAELALEAKLPSHRVMLEHMAETWQRICDDLIKMETN
jgi:hypothetical protein